MSTPAPPEAALVEELPAGPSPSGDDAAFWHALDEHRLVLPRCSACGTWRPIGSVMCDACWSLDLEWAEVRPVGHVYTWVRTHRGFMSELDVAAPYVTVLVELDDAPLRLLGILRADAVAIGDPVTGVFEKPEHAAWTVLRWEPAA